MHGELAIPSEGFCAAHGVGEAEKQTILKCPRCSYAFFGGLPRAKKTSSVDSARKKNNDNQNRGKRTKKQPKCSKNVPKHRYNLEGQQQHVETGFLQCRKTDPPWEHPAVPTYRPSRTCHAPPSYQCLAAHPFPVFCCCMSPTIGSPYMSTHGWQCSFRHLPPCSHISYMLSPPLDLRKIEDGTSGMG